MRDDQIRDLLRTLEKDRDPDPAFADALHATLAGMSHRRSRRWPLVLLAAAAILAVAGGAALGSGLIDTPVTAEATPTPSSTSATATPAPTATESPPDSFGASPTASPSTDPHTPDPTPTPDQATALGVAPGLLPPGSLVTVSGNGVRIREEPSTDADIVATMAAGDLAFIAETPHAGPVTADGYDWYRVAYRNGDDVWPWQDVGPDGLVEGWMAGGNDDERFVMLSDVACPTGPIALSDLAFGLTGWERLVCINDGSVTIEGTFGCDSCIEPGLPGASPPWLADIEQQPPIGGSYEYYPSIRVAVPPGLVRPDNRDIVRATLRVDDPAASSCAFGPDPSAPRMSPDLVVVEIYCRERLVLDSFEVIGHDDFPGG